MFEDFFDQFDKELGPLNPSWFEELTARSSRDNGGPDISKDEEEENSIKAPETSAQCSQLFSTPKIFKQHFQSPDSSNEESPYEAADSSPSLFGSGKDTFNRSHRRPSNYFGLMDTPKRSLAHSSKQISESLGAQINPDLSWTSSFNTPSTLTPTVILPKAEDRPSTASCFKDKDAIFVRKLFPSLSKASESTSSKIVKLDDTIETIQTEGMGRKPIFSPDASLDTSNLWKQKVPNAIEDGDVRSTVQSVLDGAEDVLSIFFSNSTSALRRVKSKERNRTKNNSLKDINSTLETDNEVDNETLKTDKTHSDEVETKSPPANNDVMQWTPLSLSDSSLNENISSSLALNTGKPNGDTFYSSAAGRTFLSSAERLRSYPDPNLEGSQCQKSLLDKSPVFTLTKKPRKFVYQVPSSAVSKMGINHKTAPPLCLKQAVMANPSMSGDLNESIVVSDDAGHPQTLQQITSHHLDEGLDMTQLSKAFAEDFTQELTSGGLVDLQGQSNQNVSIVSSTITTHVQKTCEVQPEAESEQKKDFIIQQVIQGDHDVSCALADVSMDSANESTVVPPTFEVSRDSGFPTTFSDLDGTVLCSNSKDVFSGFKTASNKTISIPNEAIIKAKALLHDAIGDSLIDVTTQHNQKMDAIGIDTTRSLLEQSNSSKHALTTCVSNARSNPGLLSSKSVKHSISSCSSPQINELDYETGSKSIITVSDVGPQEPGTLLKENLEEESDSSKHKQEFGRVAEIQTVLDNNSTNKADLDTSRDENCPLTASQKADVTELCNLLEEADSQYEFTQFKPTKFGSDSHTTEKDWDPDILNGIDFDDSFNCDAVKGSHLIKTDASNINNFVQANKEIDPSPVQTVGADKLCSVSKEFRNGNLPASTTEDNSVDGINNHFSDTNQSHCFGFKTATGKVISVSETSLNKAKHFFEEHDEKVSYNENNKADTEVLKPEESREQAMVSSANTSDCIGKEYISPLHLNQHANAALQDPEVNENLAGDAGTKPNCLDRKTDVVCVYSDGCFGFSTASGKHLKVSETALEQASKLLNDVDSIEASDTKQLLFHTSGRHDDSMSTTNLQKTKAVSWRETSININQSDCEEINQVSNVPDISSIKRKNFFQEQKSGSDAEGIFTNICLPNPFQPLSGHGYGFKTASGKGVRVSAEALEKSKIIFKDCNENIEAGIIEETNDKLDIEILKQTNGFTIASGSKVVLKEAKAVYEDSALIRGFCEKANKSLDVVMKTCRGDQVHYEEKPSLDRQNPQKEACETKVKELRKDFEHESISLSSSFGFSTASGRKLSVSAEALQKAKNVLSDSADVAPCTSGSRKSKQITEMQTDNSSLEKHDGFSTAGGKRVTISAIALQRARNLFNECESIEPENLQHQNCKGFVNAKGVIVSEKGCIIEADPDLQSGSKFQNSNGSNGPMSRVSFGCGSSTEEPKGFCTAGGKKVDISPSALQRAKSLFKDCEEDRLTSEALQNQSNKGFTTASGKHVAVSEKALYEIKAGFVDFSISHNSPVNKVSCDKGVPSATSGSSDEQVGFCTAGGKKVAISTSALQRAASLFQDCEEETLASEEPVVPKTESSKDTMDENLKLDQLNKTNYSFSTASGKSVSISKVALEQATTLFRDCDAQQVIDTDKQAKSSNTSDLHVADSQSHQELPIILDGFKEEANKTISHPTPTKVVPNELTQLNLHSLDFKSCTETQQEYSEREAMACAKALLADEDLNEPPPPELMPVANIHSTKSPSVHDLQTQGTVEQNGKRKHQLDTSSTADSCQPPSKRQLLSEFDQAVGCSKSTPKSCPNGLLKGRRAFRYNIQPNVTPPNRSSVDQKSNDGVQQCSAASVQSKRPVFVPPFQKGVKTKTSKAQDASKASSGFIPPFKKENKDSTNSNCSIKNSCESKTQAGSCKAMENETTCTTPTTHSAAQYYGEDNPHADLKPEATISMDNISMKKIDYDERDTDAWQETLQLARDMQDMRLGKKKRQTVRPLPGKLYLAKTSGVSRIGLRDAVGHKCPVGYTSEELYKHGVLYKVSQINSENAESFRFDCKEFFKRELLAESGSIQLADGGWLVPDSKGTVGKEEFCRALFDTPGVDPKLISDAWVFNHYRWIVWKRASMEKSFPELMGSLCLTPEQVLLQLKLRYDVEVDHSHRSSLRRIVERDDTPAKTLVLCVCGIAKPSQNPEKQVKTDDRSPDAKMESTVLWLTDGWYPIKGLLDLPLSAMLSKGRLKVGDKVVVNGAELVGCQEACPPLEAPESLMLKISANSTRRARWDTKLGYYRDPRPFRLPLSSLYAAGGAVSCVDIVVLRSYPTQWMEKMPNGVFIFRNDRAEDREARKHSNSKHKTMELLISNIQAQFEKEMEGKKKSQGRRRTFSQHEIEALQDGEELYEAMESDPAVENHLSERQMEAVNKFRCCLEERRQVDLQQRVQMALNEAQEADGGCPDRGVTPVWKLSIIDASDPQSNSVYTLNIWRPSADLRGLLKEGRRYRTYHLATSEGKKRSGIAQIQLTATKKTLFQDIEVTPEWLHLHFQPRVCVCFRELQNPQFSSPCGEVDNVGNIFSIVDKQGNSPVLHLVDEKFDVVSVRLSSSLEQLAIEELIKPQALLALSNVQLRQLSGPVPCLYAGEQTLFSINPKDSHLQEAMVHMKSFVQTCKDFFSIAEEKVSDLFPAGSFQCPRTPGVSIPKVNGGVTPQQKGRVFSPFTPVTKRTPAPTSGDCESKDPKNLKRKRGLVYLSRIPSPPPITPLKTKASPCVNKTFNPPRKSVTPKPPEKVRDLASRSSHRPSGEEEWVPDEEFVMIDTQALLDGLQEAKC
ncbi:LOW QUALITY PROTEIN: breast cancer type 2 susceptibility protein [Misgurnus anguillicaudatus]|uniref:LOW QUALITY PROTEIN: breast cancer type 2 susceptibility protein n=1 Tax=Misgurnus anguillicaudatus TaxID=75329 RepID=UPI003CCF85FC